MTYATDEYATAEWAADGGADGGLPDLSMFAVPSHNSGGAFRSTITREPGLLVPLEVGETDVLTFDYTDRLVDAETIVSAVTTISVVNGTDPSPSGLLVGTTQVTTPYALQKVTGAVRNVTYLCYCAATTSTGRVLVNAGLLPVIAFGQP